MKKRTYLILLCFVLFALPASAQYYLGVIKGEAKKIPIAILDVADETGDAGLVPLTFDVLNADLRRSGVFDVRDAKQLDLVQTGAAEPSEDLRKKSGVVGLSGVVWAKWQKIGTDLVLAGRVYDSSTGVRIAAKDYYGNRDISRRLVHAFADEIVKQFTGERGIARSRIAFVSDKTKAKELSVMDYDGRSPIRVTADHSICLSPAWSPDGKILAYVSYRDRNPDLFALDVETGRRWKL
jgi:TolB protein